jgi:DNA polymerase-1
VWTLDFETEGIRDNTSWHPPKPVGVAFKHEGGSSIYLGWGHPIGNNCDWERGKAEVAAIITSGEPILCHHSKFDLSVAAYWFDLPWPKDSLLIHDTMYLIFLHDPYSPNLKLKPNAERLLNMAPDAQDKLEEWIRRNIDGANNKDWGAYISLAPGELVGEYACADVDMTYELFQLLMPTIEGQGMVEAYQREQRLMPILYGSEKKGVRCDTNRLAHDLDIYEKALVEVENNLGVKVGQKDVDWGNPASMADALDAGGLIGEWIRTPTGRRSVAKDNIALACNDPEAVVLLSYRQALATSLQTFMRPWKQDSSTDGRLHTTWNQVRTDLGGGSVGTRTGRLSGARPYLMNISNEYDITIPAGLPDPPLMRRYLLPEEGHVWLKRDFSSQEIRICAHYEDGQLLEAYIQNPSLDPHALAQEIILAQSQLELARKHVKITAFRIIYGSGIPGLASGLGVDNARAARTLDAYFRAFPGIAQLSKDTKRRGHSGRPITTWGGRIYYTEPPKLIKGRMRSFEYKLLNYLIQGSAADQTKECVIRWDEQRNQDAVFLATVHDEINISAPMEIWRADMDDLRHVMDADLFDVPFQSEGFVGPNWFDLEKCK